MKITRTSIAKLPPPGNDRRTFWDDALSGFGITQQVSGKISYIAKFRVAGRQVLKTLGTYPALTPEKARHLHSQYLANAALGVDLSAKIAAERRAQETINDLCNFYERNHLPRKRPQSAIEDLRKIKRIIRPKLGSKRIADVARADIAALHTSMISTPVEANRVLALLSKMFSLGILEGYRPDNPTKGIQKFPETPRERHLSEEEFSRLRAVLEVYEALHPDTIAMIRLLAFTGARKSEVVNCTWDQFDLVAGVWSKPAAYTKQKRTHRVPLASEAIVELVKIKRRSSPMHAGAPVFPLSHDGKLTALKRLWKLICTKADLRDFRIHDLRHSFAATILGERSSLPIVGKLLGHTQASTTKRYEHFLDSPLRDALGAISKRQKRG